MGKRALGVFWRAARVLAKYLFNSFFPIFHGIYANQRISLMLLQDKPCPRVVATLQNAAVVKFDDRPSLTALAAFSEFQARNLAVKSPSNRGRARTKSGFTCRIQDSQSSLICHIAAMRK